MAKVTDIDKEKKPKDEEKAGIETDVPGEGIFGLIEGRDGELPGSDRTQMGAPGADKSVQAPGGVGVTGMTGSGNESPDCPECGMRLDPAMQKCLTCGFILKSPEKDDAEKEPEQRREQASEIDIKKSRVKQKLDRMADKWAHLKYKQIEESNLKKKSEALETEFVKKEEETKAAIARDYDNRLKKAISKLEAEHAAKLEEARNAYQGEFDARIKKRLDDMKTELRKQEDALRLSLDSEFSEKLDAAKKRFESEAKEREKETIEELEQQYKPKLKKRLDEFEEDLDHREEEIRKNLEARYQKKFEELSARIELETKEREREKLAMLELEHKKRVKEKVSEIDSEIKKRESELMKEMELGYSRKFDERAKAMEAELRKKEESIRKSLEDEFGRKADALQKSMEAEANAVEREGTRVALEYKKHMKEELAKLNIDLKKKEDEFRKLMTAIRKEKDTELLEAYKIIDVQSDILMKILEKDESLILRILSELNMSIDDLKKVMGG